MTERREWPNAARESRDRSAEEAAQILAQLCPLINGVNGDCLHDGDR